MTVLDEDIPEDQYQLLVSWRLRVSRIGIEVGWFGMKDREILTLLHGLNRPTLFSLDHGFFDRAFCHARYCLVHLDIEEGKAAEYVRRTLRQQELNTWSKRMGTVVRVQVRTVAVWRVNAKSIFRSSWK